MYHHKKKSLFKLVKTAFTEFVGLVFWLIGAIVLAFGITIFLLGSYNILAAMGLPYADPGPDIIIKIVSILPIALGYYVMDLAKFFIEENKI